MMKSPRQPLLSGGSASHIKPFHEGSLDPTSRKLTFRNRGP
ncbi:hypothetical protein RB10419 [Rhodopirellula baltica SH 1]|uniref:Uncharacterized protein n=1 Tax=Rhodopirellula baltica (strain DSM 10527 / NCIMB 13988 / SH1) TaxID=243090 RepID=Q7UF10_RHOBA|nr:hypothetical protein RB10419 [Rhodopirellula baltica SH 1]